jgi:S-adenosyl-L-methionine hydrolase (adenosine-forming)
MSIITLTTDWQNDDFYIGAVKGFIYTNCPDARVVDITHRIEGFKYAHAAFILGNIYRCFPAGTIHIIGVNSEVTENQSPLCIFIDGQYFIGSGQGLFGTLFTTKPERVIELTETNGLYNSTFPELTIFTRAACLINNGLPIDELGHDITTRYRNLNIGPIVEENMIIGRVVYVDSFDNLVTNINRQLFTQTVGNRKFVVTVKSDTYNIYRIVNNYSQVDGGDLLALFNSLDLLEIAQRNGRFAEMTGAKIDSPVTVKFR